MIQQTRSGQNGRWKSMADVAGHRGACHAALVGVVCLFLLAGLSLADDAAPSTEANATSPRDASIELSQQELLDYYAEHKDEWAFPASVKWRQIVVQRRPDETREAAEKRAREVLAQLREGADFAELARRHSIGATRDKGGYWGWTDKGVPACEEDEEFLFTGKIGSTSDVLPFGDEFHILHVIDRREAGHRSFEKVEPTIRERLTPALRYDPEFPDTMVVATVNSVPITVGYVLDPVRQQLEEKLRIHNVAEEQHSKIREAWVKHMLADVVERKLRVHGLTSGLAAEQRKALEEYLDKAWEEYTAQLRKEHGVSTMEELADQMERQGIRLAKVKQHWRDGSMAHQFVLLKVDSSYEPTSGELHDYYEAHRAEWDSPTRVKWQQIVVRRQKGELSDEAQGRARELLVQLRSGADFADLAREHSDGPTKSQGGHWDWTESRALACREIGDFLSTGKVGSTSEVIRHKDDFQIVKLLEREEAHGKSFEEVEGEIRNTLKGARRERLAHEMMQELVDKAVILTVFGNQWKFEKPAAEGQPEGKKPEGTAKTSTEPSLDAILSRLRESETSIFDRKLDP